jgi:hypothetical protein
MWFLFTTFVIPGKDATIQQLQTAPASVPQTANKITNAAPTSTDTARPTEAVPASVPQTASQVIETAPGSSDTTRPIEFAPTQNIGLQSQAKDLQDEYNALESQRLQILADLQSKSSVAPVVSAPIEEGATVNAPIINAPVNGSPIQYVGNNNQAPVVQLANNSTFNGNVVAEKPPRTITDKQKSDFIQAAKDLPKTRIDFMVASGDREAFAYAKQLSDLFQAAGYQTDMTSVMNNIPYPSLAVGLPDSNRSLNAGETNYAKQLFDALHAADISTSVKIGSANPILVFVGAK